MVDTEEKAPTKPDLTEAAGTRDGRDITRGYTDGLPYLTANDPVLIKAGGYQGYEQILQDDQVSACFAQRRHAVISRPWSVTPGGTKRLDKLAAKLVEDTLKHLDWDTITDQMLYARFYGFAVAEVLWCIKDDLVKVSEIKVRDRQRFVFAPDYTLRMLTMRKPDGEALPERKFWHKAVGASHADEPYGLGLASALYWPVWFKHNGARFWATYLEKFAAPTAMGEFPRGTEAAERTALLKTLQAISTDAGIIVPEGVKVQLLEASRGGQATYEGWMAYWDSAIAKIILGQTMTTEDGSSYSQATVHYNVRQDLVKADADLICQSASCWVRWLVDYNYPGAAYPEIWRDMDDAEDLKERVARDKTLFEMGYKLTPEAVARIYGDDYELIQPVAAPAGEVPSAPDKEKPAATPEKQIGFRLPTFAEPVDSPLPVVMSAATGLDRYIDPVPLMLDALDSQTAPAWDQILAVVQAMVAEAPDLPTLRDQLLGAFHDLPSDDLSKTMQLALLTAELSGQYDVRDESDG